MADYFSIQEVLSGTDNMTFIRNNVGNDSGTDTAPGVSWFLYNSGRIRLPASAGFYITPWPQKTSM